MRHGISMVIRKIFEWVVAPFFPAGLIGYAAVALYTPTPVLVALLVLFAYVGFLSALRVLPRWWHERRVRVTLTPIPAYTNQQQRLELLNLGRPSEFWVRYRIIDMRHAIDAEKADVGWHLCKWINTSDERSAIQQNDRQTMLIADVREAAIPKTEKLGGLLQLWERHHVGLDDTQPFEFVRWNVGDPWPEVDLEMQVFSRDIKEPYRQTMTLRATSLTSLAMSATQVAR